MDYFDCCAVVELNVGGVVYTTTRSTLTSEPGSLLSEIFSERKLSSAVSNAKQSYFLGNAKSNISNNIGDNKDGTADKTVATTTAAATTSTLSNLKDAELTTSTVSETKTTSGDNFQIKYGLQQQQLQQLQQQQQQQLQQLQQQQQLEDRSSPLLLKDGRGRYFIDRDGVLFRFVLDYLRNGRKLVLPDCFLERKRLIQEADYYRLPGLLEQIKMPLQGAAAVDPTNVNRSIFNSSSEQQQLQQQLQQQNSITSSCNRQVPSSPSPSLTAGSVHYNFPSDNTPSSLRISPVPSRDPGFIVVGYRGTFAFGRDGCQADVKFRKMWRILVSGKVSLCREVFKDTLNESRDVDRGTTDRYTTRFFLKHQFLEQAFDMLQESGFKLLAACGSGTNSAGGDLKPGMDLEESKWNHYNEFVFARE